MIAELGELFVRIENGEGPSVAIFDSADPDYFLAHFDISPASLVPLHRDYDSLSEGSG
jgi:hypothetical protein